MEKKIQMVWRNLYLLLVMTMALYFVGCGGGGGGGGSDSTVTTPAGAVNVATSLVLPGGTCPNGGISVESGIDENLNGTLDPEEVDAVQYVCNGLDGADGQDGTNGLNALVSVLVEAAGANCPAGGYKVETGTDTSNDGALDPAEVTQANYLCNGQDGADGINGADGTNGLTTLLVITPELPGENCVNGGQLVESGLDASDEGILDPEEVSTSAYICNGAPAGINWVEVTGTTEQASANSGYIANNPAQVTITLPLAPQVGDVIEVVGSGAGGWKIAQNEGQSILGMSAHREWKPTGSPAGNWISIAASSDGTKLLAAQYGGSIFTSTDSGANWIQRQYPAAWYAVASSADGTKLVAAQSSGIFTSTDSGVNWVQRYGGGYWSSLASSADGTILAAAQRGGPIFISTNSGASWTPRMGGNWFSVASSANGTKLIAAYYGVGIFTSADSGATWTQRQGAGDWQAVASSADGTKLVAARASGYIFTSNDSGLNWTPRIAGNWRSVASSADGRKLLAAGYDGYIYASTDSGISWTQQSSAGTGNWNALACSEDGQKRYAGIYNGNIYASTLGTSSGTSGALIGSQWTTIELQCIEPSTFLIRSFDGELSYQ